MMSDIHTSGFTIVTPGYLAHGFALKESFLQHNPHCKFYICIIGRKENLPAEAQGEFFFITEIDDSRITSMLQQYSAFEMSCAVKPFFASLLFNMLPDINHLIYLDADILVFGNFQSLPEASITISPHRTNKIGFLPEQHPLSDISLNRFGVFNAGYFEIMRSDEGFRFLEWWKQLMNQLCYNKPDNHLFVDQLWLNCIPAFFETVSINKNPGYNFAYWNLIERKLTEKNGQFFVNGQPLIFYHYSLFKFESPEKMTSFENEFLSFKNFPELKELYSLYKESVIRHGYHHYKKLLYPFQQEEKPQKISFLKKIFR